MSPRVAPYLLAFVCGAVAELGVGLAINAAGDSARPAILLLFAEAVVLGWVFGPRPGMLGAVAPLLSFALIDTVRGAGNRAGELWTAVLYVTLLLAFTAGMTGALRARYGRPRRYSRAPERR